jgi:pyruvate,water dikinase
MNTTNYTCWFSEIRAANPDLIGEKGAELNRLTTSGFPVRPGFCITVEAYNYLLKVTGLNLPIDLLLAETNFEDPEDIAACSLAISDLVKQQPIPREIAGEVLESYNKLGRQMGFRHLEGMPVSVGPSITIVGSQEVMDPDTETYRILRGGCTILKHVRSCWAALWTYKSLSKLRLLGIDHNNVKVAVIVQAVELPKIIPEFFNSHIRA